MIVFGAQSKAPKEEYLSRLQYYLSANPDLNPLKDEILKLPEIDLVLFSKWKHPRSRARPTVPTSPVGVGVRRNNNIYLRVDVWRINAHSTQHYRSPSIFPISSGS